jgi:hypothetical protein
VSFIDEFVQVSKGDEHRDASEVATDVPIIEMRLPLLRQFNSASMADASSVLPVPSSKACLLGVRARTELSKLPT